MAENQLNPGSEIPETPKKSSLGSNLIGVGIVALGLTLLATPGGIIEMIRGEKPLEYVLGFIVFSGALFFLKAKTEKRFPGVAPAFALVAIVSGILILLFRLFD